MINIEATYDNIINLLNKNTVEYKLFSHKEALSWEDLAEVQEETGFFGAEMKCMIIKADEKFIVYLTIQGKKIDFGKIKEKIGAKKVRLSTAEELSDEFGVKPGCAYPFGFDSKHDIYVDLVVFEQEWVLFSPVLPTKTVQARGIDLKNVFNLLDNRVQEVRDFNQ